MRGSVSGQCRSKTVIGIKVEQRARFIAEAQTKKTPQAESYCGVLERNWKGAWRLVDDQNLGDSLGGL